MAKTWKILNSDNLILRKPEPEDLDFLYSIENNPEFWFVSESKSPYSKWQLKQHIESSVYDIYTNKELRLIIESQSDNKQIGVIDLFEFDPFHNRMGIGILIHKHFQSKGIASESLKMIIGYCFNMLEINTLWCNIDSNNIVSIKLFENLGFERTGILKQWKKQKGNYKDVYFYQLLHNENTIS